MRVCTIILACGCSVLLVPASIRAEDKNPPIKVRDEKPFVPYDHLLPINTVIQQYQDRLKANPKDGPGYTQLANLYIRKARETGDYASYELAEDCARKALGVTKDDLSAQVSLAVVYSAQHKFPQALALARELYRKHPTQHELLFVIGDAFLELGEHGEAEKAYADLKKKQPGALLGSRLARLAELHGKNEEAIKLMKLAVEEEGAMSFNKEGRAWHPFRLGEMHFHAGKLDEAAKYLQEALEFNPKYPLALAWLGKVRAAQGKHQDAIKLYVQAIALNAELFMLADLGDLYTTTGKEFLAKLNYDKLEQAGKKQDVYARELSLFYSDHDRNLPEALELAKKDLAVRKDVYAYDTLAWALYKNKQYQEALEAMNEALKTGNKDASVLYHAGMIRLGIGDREIAQRFLKHALERNPSFSLLQAEKARQALKALGG